MDGLNVEQYAAKLDEIKPRGPLPLDGSILTTRIPLDYLNLSELVIGMMSALMIEKPYVASQVMDADRDFWEGAASSELILPEEQLKLVTLLKTLCEHIDMLNYRFELVKTVPRHR